MDSTNFSSLIPYPFDPRDDYLPARLEPKKLAGIVIEYLCTKRLFVNEEIQTCKHVINSDVTNLQKLVSCVINVVAKVGQIEFPSLSTPEAIQTALYLPKAILKEVSPEDQDLLNALFLVENIHFRKSYYQNGLKGSFDELVTQSGCTDLFDVLIVNEYFDEIFRFFLDDDSLLSGPFIEDKYLNELVLVLYLLVTHAEQDRDLNSAGKGATLNPTKLGSALRLFDEVYAKHKKLAKIVFSKTCLLLEECSPERLHLFQKPSLSCMQEF